MSLRISSESSSEDLSSFLMAPLRQSSKSTPNRPKEQDEYTAGESLPTLDYTYRKEGLLGWFKHLWMVYDKTVLLVVGL
jgi:hypothetical protein